MRRGFVLLVAFAMVLVVPVGLGAPAAAAGNPAATPDFNNDGYADLVIPDPSNTVGGLARAGSFWVVPGSGSGPVLARAQLVSKATSGVPGSPASGGYFAASWAAGDFNRDGYSDLAVGSPGDNSFAGSVYVFKGSSVGLRTSGVVVLTRDTPGVPGLAAAGDSFGFQLGAGDVTGDGRDDLVVAAPGADVGGVTDAGAIFVVPGTSSGLTGSGTKQFDQNTPGVPGLPQTNGYFGDSGFGLGDFNGDGRPDLSVNARFNDVSGKPNAGAQYVLYGAAGGLSGSRAQLITQDTPGVPGAAATNDYFGYGDPAVVDFDRDGYDDIVLSVAFEDVGGLVDQGQLYVIRGGPSGLRLAGIQVITKNTPGVPGVPASYDYFGYLGAATGDFNRDGYSDVAQSASYDDFGGLTNAGQVYVFGGRAGGFSTTGTKVYNQDTPGVGGAAENGDYFSEAGIYAADFNGDGRDDLFVPADGEDLGAVTNAGVVHVLFGSSSGLTGAASLTFTRGQLPGGTNIASSFFSWCCY